MLQGLCTFHPLVPAPGTHLQNSKCVGEGPVQPTGGLLYSSHILPAPHDFLSSDVLFCEHEQHMQRVKPFQMPRMC